MIIKQLYTDNKYRNFNYLIVCSETGEAIAVDPFDANLCLNAAKQEGFDITYIINTHEHFDHIAGNEALQKATKAKIGAHAKAKYAIPNMDKGFEANDILTVGKTIEIQILDTPGHTFSHICLLAHADNPCLFSGDTLFNAGAGNCHSGDAQSLYQTFSQQLYKLPDNTLLYPGHDYINNNLGFTLSVEKHNSIAKEYAEALAKQDPHHALVTTLAIEKQINCFFRLHISEVTQTLQSKFPNLGPQPSEKNLFLSLRELRNDW